MHSRSQNASKLTPKRPRRLRLTRAGPNRSISLSNASIHQPHLYFSTSLSRRSALTKTQRVSPRSKSRANLSLSRRSFSTEIVPPPLIPPITSSSSFLHRSIKAIYDTPNLQQKIAAITEARHLLKTKTIPTMNWDIDRDMWFYLHYSTTQPDRIPSPDYYPSLVSPDPFAQHNDANDPREYMWGDIAKNSAWSLSARPERPNQSYRLYSAKDLGVPSNAHILHTIAHIELNAVEMYLDTAIRFGIVPTQHEFESAIRQTELESTHKSFIQSGDQPFVLFAPYSPSLQLGQIAPRLRNVTTPDAQTRVWADDTRFTIQHDGFNLASHPQFLPDILSIVSDESRHFQLCCQRLEQLSEEHNTDFSYGTQPVTFQLWVLGVNTRCDIAERIAVLSLSEESRGLDGSARFLDRLYGCGDTKSAQLVWQICKEEERHVSIALKWLLETAVGTQRQIVSPGFCAEYDYHAVPEIELTEKEHYQWHGRRSQKQQYVSPAKLEQRQIKYDEQLRQLDHHVDAYDGTDDEYHIAAAAAAAPAAPVDDELINVPAYTSRAPQYVPKVSSQAIISQQDRDSCQENIGIFWRENVTDHFPAGFFPPFNRLARYASGMPESWYLPLANEKYPVQFVGVPQNAPAVAPVRRHFKRLIDNMGQPSPDIEMLTKLPRS